MSQEPGGSQHHPGTWATWVAFAGLMMILIGIFDVLAGLAAVTGDSYFSANGGTIFIFDLTVAGILWIAIGILVGWAGWALIQGAEWARFFTIFITFLNAAVNLVALPARPLLSLILIGLNVAVLFAVTVRWEDARVGLRE